MRLTERGRDYLLGILLLETVGLATGANLFAALALALAFASLISMALLKLLAPRSLNVSTLDDHIRLFKHQEGRLALSLQGKRDRWTSPEVESVAVDGAVETSVLRDGENFVVKVKPMKAGRFAGFKVNVRLGDAIGLFSLRRQAVLDQVVLDSLPISLLSQMEPRRPLSVVIGESPVGRPGKGQEFYGIEVYSEQSESRDILWKRAANSPHGPLLARVREANSPDSISIIVAHGEVGEERRVDCIDLQCEALGLLGRTLLANRVEVVTVGPDGVRWPAKNEEELADAIMEISGGGMAVARGKIRTVGLGIIMAVGDFPGSELSYLGRHPVVFVGTKGRHPMDRYSMDFTGDEDLGRILGLVLVG
jgi:uncharacterized protein (DUF58 family)